MPHQPTMNVLSVMGRNGSLSPSAARKHNSSNQKYASSSSKNNDYDSFSRYQRHSTSSESSPDYINRKSQSFGRSCRKLRSSSSRSRSRSPRSMHRVLNSRKSCSRSPRKNTEHQNQEGLDLDLPETYQIDCWSQSDQESISEINIWTLQRSTNIFWKYVHA